MSTRYWIVKPGSEEETLELMQKNLWEASLSAGEPSQATYEQYRQEAIKENANNGDGGRGLKGIWDLRNEVKPGDRFVLIQNTDVKAIGTVLKDPGYSCRELPERDADSKNVKHYKFRMHSRGVEWKKFTGNVVNVSTSESPVNLEGYQSINFLEITQNLPLLRLVGLKEQTANPNVALNRIFSGPPGTGKTYNAIQAAVDLLQVVDKFKGEESHSQYRSWFNYGIELGRIEFVTFHQNYDYSDFIQGIRPKAKKGAIGFDVQEGPLKRLADRARRDTDNNYVLVIDEINRGNVAKIFGELISLIEDDKRHPQKNGAQGLSTPLLYDDGDERFSVPENLYIIGTMNTADRSIQRLDSALRRRFVFENYGPRPNVLGAGSVLAQFLEEINSRILEAKQDPGSLIGHAWFMKNGKPMDNAGAAKALKEKVIPLLIEWFPNQIDILREKILRKSYGLAFHPNGLPKEDENTIDWDKFIEAGEFKKGIDTKPEQSVNQ